MKRDINLKLLWIIAGLLIAIVVLAVYSNETYKMMNKKYYVSLSRLKEIEAKLNLTEEKLRNKSKILEEKEKMLIDIINQLNLTEQKITSLSGYYSELKGEKEILEEKLAKEIKEKESYKSKYLETVQSLEICKQDKKLKDAQLSILNEKIANVMEKSEAALNFSEISQARLGDANFYLNKIENKLSHIHGDLNEIKEALEESNLSTEYIKDIEDVIDAIEETKSYRDEAEKKVNKVRNHISYVINLLNQIREILEE